MTSSGTGTAAALRSLSGATGVAGQAGTLTYTINGGCGTTTVSRAVWAGKPGLVSVSASGSVSGSVVCANQNVSFTASAQGATSYRWSVTGGTASSTSGSQINVYTGSSGGLSVTVTATNSCGNIVRSQTYSIASSIGGSPCFDGGGPTPSVVVYPNPANGVLTIELPEGNTLEATEAASMSFYQRAMAETGTGSGQSSFSIELIDSRQCAVREATSVGRKIQLDVRDLSPGIYFLHVHSREGILQKQIVME